MDTDSRVEMLLSHGVGSPTPLAQTQPHYMSGQGLGDCGHDRTKSSIGGVLGTPRRV